MSSFYSLVYCELKSLVYGCDMYSTQGTINLLCPKRDHTYSWVSLQKVCPLLLCPPTSTPWEHKTTAPYVKPEKTHHDNTISCAKLSFGIHRRCILYILSLKSNKSCFLGIIGFYNFHGTHLSVELITF